MPLNTAHEGYEYQDLLTAFFVLEELLNENDSVFTIDSKEHSDDKFDDLTISNSNGVFKKQIKYSNELSDHTATKDDFATSNNYDLAFYDLFRSWNSNRAYNYRTCLAWNEPTDKLIDFLKVSSKPKTFENNITKVFEIDIDKLWPTGNEPESSWRKFRTESSSINRTDFELFCNDFIIETNFPKQSLNTDFSGELEAIISNQISRLGIGTYPNEHYNIKSFALELLKLITRSRSRGLGIRTNDIFIKFNIKTDFGSIEQIFPIDSQRNIKTEDNINSFITQLERTNKIILQGEPGSGKSWFVQNLQSRLKEKGFHVVRHYCYTELKDRFSTERITLNVFYGNLIKEILDAFPHLKDTKHKRYASNLYELNQLLQNIDKDTLVIIDGLDHIERVFSYKQAELTLNDIAIIDAINNLNVSDNIKILLVSQPIHELNTLNGYETLNIPKWTDTETLDYFAKNQISDIELQDEKKLHELLTIKSNGNPLYLNYLVEEIKTIQVLTTQKINLLPAYNYNLKDYYQYLLDKLNLDKTVPQILSGANFSLTKLELREITHQGKNVDKALTALKPILNEKLTNGGVIIYHESFRRFILEKLEEDEIDINRAIFKPIIDWFKEKDFFNYTKAYRFYFQLLFDTGDYDSVLGYLTTDFIIQSIYNGHSFDAVKNNYYFMAKSAIKNVDFPNIILANELNKVLSSTEDVYYDDFHLYFSALGHLKGFKSVSEHLAFEEKPTLPLLTGLEACYLCDQNNEPSPWHLYYDDYFANRKEISISEFRYFIRGLLVLRETQKLAKIATDVLEKHKRYVSVFANELEIYSDSDYLQELYEYDDVLSKICNYTKPIAKTEKDLLTLANEILSFNNLFDREISTIDLFFNQIDVNIEDENTINNVLKLFTAKNWFYNWIVYYIKLKKAISKKEGVDYSKIEEAFKFLIYDTEPFKGNPRTSDLHSLGDYLYNSFSDGLKHLKTELEWKVIIEILVEISHKTTTEIQKNIGGPLPTDKLFQLLEEYSNDTNRTLIINEFVNLINEKEKYQLHSYLAGYCFRLTKQYALNNDKGKADKYFQKGLKFFIGYTFRRDRTIEDLLYSIESYSNINEVSGNEYIKKIKSLINAVTDHTDGKNTKWFPVEWYQKYFRVNHEEASFYLLSQIKRSYYWIYERQLQDLLIYSDTNINPTVEAFLFLTFPVDADEDFLLYGLNLIEKLKNGNHILAKTLTENIIQKLTNRKNNGFNNSFIEKLNSILKHFELESFNAKGALPEKKTYPYTINLLDTFKAQSISRKQFSEMSASEMIEHFSENEIKDTDLISLCYYFDDLEFLTPEIEELVDTIVREHEKYRKNPNVELSIIFDNDNDISAHYWISQFVYEQDGSYNSFKNKQAFEKAFYINKDIAIKSLTNQIEKFTQIGGYNRSVSSGLINNLIGVGYNKDIIEKMWSNLYKATDFRLPVQKTIYWNEILKDELNLNIEEVFICLLFTRLVSNTTERHHWVFSGLCYLYEHHANKMVKPTKWFLQNHKFFLTSNLIIVLEILFDISSSSKEYVQNFRDELDELVPSKFYLVNLIVTYLLDKRFITDLNGHKLFYSAQNDAVSFFANINYRNNTISRKGFSFDNVVGKYLSSFDREFQKEYQFLGNRMINRFVNNIYSPNYQIELINTQLYQEFESYPDQPDLYDFLKIDYKTIIAQNQSYTKRPDLPRPSQIENKWARKNVDLNDWVRVGYYEYELFEVKYGKSKEYRVFEGVVFNPNLAENIPFSQYRIYPPHLWEEMDMNGIDELLCVSLIQQLDMLENYKVLWLNTKLVFWLNLQIDKYTNGLAAKNELGEIVLKLNRWSADYVGNGAIAGISDEIPRLEGVELVCRKDYFEKICDFFSHEKPYSYRLKL
ncbi:AAA family ATPase [Aquimarina rhabdastrellae]